MALFSATDETHRIQLPADLPLVTEGDWVDISIVYTAAMRRRIMRRSLTANPLNDADASFDAFAYRQAVLEEVVRAWSEKEPVSPDTLGQLRPEVQDYLLAEFNRLSSGRTEAEVNGSSSSSPVGLEPVAASSPQNSSI